MIIWVRVQSLFILSGLPSTGTTGTPHPPSFYVGFGNLNSTLYDGTATTLSTQPSFACLLNFQSEFHRLGYKVMGFIMVFPDLRVCLYACLSLEADTERFHSSPLSVLRQDLSLEPRAR